MQHSPSRVVSVVEQRWNFPRKIVDGVGMATLCSIVQGIAPILQKGNAYRMYDSEATRHVPPHPIKGHKGYSGYMHSMQSGECQRLLHLGYYVYKYV